MKILLAEYSGFCFGVKNAVSTAYNTKDKNGNSNDRIYTYGPIIHNDSVVMELEEKGIKQLAYIDELKDNDTVIIRSHGVSRQVIKLLEDRNINIVDATCPYVNNIHKKVEEYFNKGYKIAIVGDANHPEVIGINGWCDNTALIINSENDFCNILEPFKKVCIVSQTTMNLIKWKCIVSSLLDISKEIIIFNTICSATEKRQLSAMEMSKKCDTVIVLGGYNSSNTKKLAEICKNYCPRTYHVETINEFDISKLKNITTLGITAGASTPDWIIKEAIDKMNDFENTNEKIDDQFSMMDEYEKTLVRLHPGDVVKGRVIYVNDNEATVDVGYKADGVITKDELNLSEDQSPKDILKSGDEIEVYVIKVNDGEGNVLLSKKRVDAAKSLEYIEQSFNNKTPVEGIVTRIVNGGVIVNVKGADIFMPASQIDNRYVEDLSTFLNQKIKFVIITFDTEKRKIVGSRKVIVEEELKVKKAELLDTLQEGQVLSGKVSRLADFGVFVDLGGADGLIHISELSWTRIKHPSDIVKVGDTVLVYVISVDKEKGRISLSLKKTIPEPWLNIEEKLHVGDIIEGKVVRIVPFGAFVEIEKGIDGLVHISQISDKRINKAEDVLKVNDIIKAKIIDLNTIDKKISLSIKDVLNDQNKEDNEAILIENNSSDAQDAITISDILESK